MGMRTVKIPGSDTASTISREDTIKINILYRAIVTGSYLVDCKVDRALIRSEVEKLPIGVVEKLNEIFYSARMVGLSSAHLFEREVQGPSRCGRYYGLNISLASTIEEARSKAGAKFREALGAEGSDGYITAQNAVQGKAFMVKRVQLQTNVGDAAGVLAMHSAKVNSKELIVGEPGRDVQRAFLLAARLAAVSDCDYPGKEEHTRYAEMLITAIQTNTIAVGIVDGTVRNGMAYVDGRWCTLYVDGMVYAYGVGRYGGGGKNIIVPWRGPQPVPLRDVDWAPCLD